MTAADCLQPWIYLSDNGESLGENNIYLLGLPYAFAPDVQKRADAPVGITEDAGGLSDRHACLERRRHEPVSHDNFFRSVLGLLDVETKVHPHDLDIFAACRVGRLAGPAQ